jgi:hypothetical protein
MQKMPITQPQEHAPLEALFTPKPQPASSLKGEARIIALPMRHRDAARDRLLMKLVAAEGPSAVTRAADEFLRLYPMPKDQDVCLQVLQHPDEARQREAMRSLALLFLGGAESPRRRTVLESRLRRIEENADERDTRDLASELRRAVRRL